MLMGTFVVSSASPALYLASTSGDMRLGSVGDDMNASSLTTSIRGSRSTSARTVVDLPVPRSPMTMIPPMLGSMMFMIAANFISSWPMMAENGYTGRAVSASTSGSATARVATRRRGLRAGKRDEEETSAGVFEPTRRFVKRFGRDPSPFFAASSF